MGLRIAANVSDDDWQVGKGARDSADACKWIQR
jgi:hypothetical protein